MTADHRHLHPSQPDTNWALRGFRRTASAAVRRATFGALLLLSMVGSAFAASAALKLTLQDQFGKGQQLAGLFGSQPVVIVAGDEKETSEQMKTWVDALSTPLRGQAELLGLAELDSVPFFVPNSSITSKLAKLFPRVRVLCDWDNEAYERIGFSDDTLIAVGVFDPQGKLVQKLTGKHSASLQARVLASVARAAGTSTQRKSTEKKPPTNAQPPTKDKAYRGSIQGDWLSTKRYSSRMTYASTGPLTALDASRN